MYLAPPEVFSYLIIICECVNGLKAGNWYDEAFILELSLEVWMLPALEATLEKDETGQRLIRAWCGL